MFEITNTAIIAFVTFIIAQLLALVSIGVAKKVSKVAVVVMAINSIYLMLYLLCWYCGTETVITDKVNLCDVDGVYYDYAEDTGEYVIYTDEGDKVIDRTHNKIICQESDEPTLQTIITRRTAGICYIDSTVYIINLPNIE